MLKINYRIRFTTRGRFTMPAAVRKKYGLKGGDRLSIEVTPTGGFILTPVRTK
jgi:AbrB family looped-hinge helix DNA binding protein